MQYQKKCFFILLICFAIMVEYAPISEAAMVSSEEVYRVEAKASGQFNIQIPAGTMKKATNSFSMGEGETVTITAAYHPTNAEVDFGLIGPDERFHYISATNGTVNITIQITDRGNYTFAVRNNSSMSVSVSGYLDY